MTQLKKEATAVDRANPISAAAARAVEYLKRRLDAKKPDGEAIRALVIAGS